MQQVTMSCAVASKELCYCKPHHFFCNATYVSCYVLKRQQAANPNDTLWKLTTNVTHPKKEETAKGKLIALLLAKQSALAMAGYHYITFKCKAVYIV
jgi:hypothetical protein